MNFENILIDIVRMSVGVQLNDLIMLRLISALQRRWRQRHLS